MAVKYVNDFEFPSDFGFQKSGKVGTTVPGKHGSKAAFKHGGKVSTPQPYRHGGHTGDPKGASMSRDTGISKPAHRLGGAIRGPESKSTPKPIESKGAGAQNVKYKQGNDHIIAKTTGEKSSGVQAPAFKHGGKAHRNAAIMKAHMARHAKGGSISADIADAPVPMGKKASWNRDDATSPGSPKRNPPGQGMKNKQAASNKFAADGENTKPATKQEGDVERMSGFSDFKKGGKVKKKACGGKVTTPQRYKEGGEVSADRFERGERGEEHASPVKKAKGGYMGEGVSTPQSFKKGGHDRIKNLGHYAHGGKVKPGTGPANADKYESSAGTPKKSHDGTKGERPSASHVPKHPHAGSSVKSPVKAGPKSTEKPRDGAAATRKEVKSAEPAMANGGLSRGTSGKRNAAIHAHEHQKSHPGAGLGALAAVLGGAGPGGAMKQPSAPGMGPTPPGMAPGMGSPPGGQMGGMAPPPGGAMGPGGMAHGGKVTHVMHHHVSYKR